MYFPNKYFELKIGPYGLKPKLDWSGNKLESRTRNKIQDPYKIQCLQIKVKWPTICYLSLNGGLCLKDVLNWNQASILQNTWTIILKSGSLLIAWLQAYVLKKKEFLASVSFIKLWLVLEEIEEVTAIS